MLFFSVINLKLFAVTILGIVTRRSNTLSIFAWDSLQFRHARSSNSNVMESMNEIKIESMTVESSVSARFAEVIVRSMVVNHMYTDNEVTFTVQIPQSAFIYNFSMMIGGKIYVGRLMEKSEAEREYNRAQDQGQSAGHVRQERPEAPDRDMDLFTISINVANKSQVTFELIYQELLERRAGYYQQRISVHPNQILSNLTLITTYFEPQGISDFYYTKPGSNIHLRASSENAVVSQSPTWLQIIYNPTIQEQSRVDAQKGLTGQFVVLYDITHTLDAGLIIYNKDFMAHFFSPPPVKTMGKNIVFVIDISGSMAGRKMEQVKQAMLAILPQLRKDDFFNIVLFDDKIITWREAPILASTDNIQSALDFSREKIVDRGTTNINGALVKAMRMFKMQDYMKHYAKIIVFLTDGAPTAGEINPNNIRANIKKDNIKIGGGRLVTLYALGFGHKMDFDFLKHLSWENGGFARRIYEAVDAGQQLKGFYNEIGNPCYVDLQFNYMTDNMVLVMNDYDVSETSHMVHDCGSEIVVVGKFENQVIDVAEIRATGADQEVTLTSTPVSSDNLHIDPIFTERLWAYVMIKDLIKESDILEDNSRASEMKIRALNMSLKYHLVTPLTSFVVTEALRDQERLPRSGNHLEKGSLQTMSVRNTFSKINSATNVAINITLQSIFLTVFIILIHVNSNELVII